MLTVLVNGKSVDTISVKDRGLNYGDGVFETIALTDSKLHLWPAHYQRLVSGCNALSITAPSENVLLNDIGQLSANRTDAVIKIVVTRGEGSRGYSVVDCKKPTVIVSINQWPQDIEQKQQGIDAYLCKHPLVVNPALAGIKHLNRLDQVIARNEWTDTAIYEGIMADNVGHLIEGCSSNLFAVRDGSLITAPASECAVAGVVRQAVIGWATQMNVPVDERKIKLSELNQLDAVFVCNSIWGILPLNKLHNAQTAMKQFSADAITLQMQQKFAFSRSTDAQTV